MVFFSPSFEPFLKLINLREVFVGHIVCVFFFLNVYTFSFLCSCYETTLAQIWWHRPYLEKQSHLVIRPGFSDAFLLIICPICSSVVWCHHFRHASSLNISCNEIIQQTWSYKMHRQGNQTLQEKTLLAVAVTS